MKSAEWSDNGYPADVVERAAALRWRLDRVDEQHRDAVATADSPGAVLGPGDSVEVKACRPWIENGDEFGTAGRFHINRSSHDALLEDDGVYAFGTYTLVDSHVVISRLRLSPAAMVDGWLSERNAGAVVKLPWTVLFSRLPAPGDREGWSR